MIIPSIDLMSGSTVQLIGGKEKALDLGDPMPWARRFGIVGEIAVVDLDAALGKGSNEGLVEQLVRETACRVGGGIRSVESAIRWLDAGATKVVLGTAARPEILEKLPRERVIVALDAVNGEVVVEGWEKKTGKSVLEQMAALSAWAGGFLVTFVEREGRLGGIDLRRAEEIIRAAGGNRVTIAGGVTTAEEIAALDRLGADAQVGMALYTERMSVADACSAVLTSGRADGLWPTLVADESGVALGLAWSNLESLSASIETKRGVYWSRSRGLWEKGRTSGAIQELIRITPDCDRDCLRFTVRQEGPGFCHQATRTCFGDDPGLGGLERVVQRRRADGYAGSYTRRLLSDPQILKSKILEEADELACAQNRSDVVSEAADLLYFTVVALAASGASIADVERELEGRSRRVSRREGNPKPRYLGKEVL